MKIKRRPSKKIYIGNVALGGNAPISVQSMTKIPTILVKRVIAQIKELEEIGCQIIRLSIPDLKSAQALAQIKKESKVPLEADIHFDYRLALAAMKNVEALRINPGNIYKEEEISAIVKQAKKQKIPLRIGLNSGSLPRDFSPSYSRLPSKNNKPETNFMLARAMVKYGLKYIRLCEREKFYDLFISLKTSDIFSTIESYRLMAKKVAYPFHLGITATGPLMPGLVKSSIGIGRLLMEGIGDTIRVSLTAHPREEVNAGYEILKALGLSPGVEIISCPTCGRCKVNLIKIVQEAQKAFGHSGHPSSLAGAKSSDCFSPLKVAIMGCAVNGPGEARDADIGVAFGGKYALLFKGGKVIKKVSEKNALPTLLQAIKPR